MKESTTVKHQTYKHTKGGSIRPAFLISYINVLQLSLKGLNLINHGCNPWNLSRLTTQNPERGLISLHF